MKINSSNIQPGVYADADFEMDFAAAMRKGGQLCTPPASKPEPVRVPPTDSALGDCSIDRCLDRRYPFTRSPVGALAQVRGFYTSARWSVFCASGRYALTGSLMHSGRSA